MCLPFVEPPRLNFKHIGLSATLNQYARLNGLMALSGAAGGRGAIPALFISSRFSIVLAAFIELMTY
jgi:hypothetical protein